MYDILQNVDVNTRSIEDSNAIEGPMKYEEASHVLKAMSNNRSPGSDGFSAVLFFKMFWKKGHFIVRSINDGFTKGVLSVTQREGVITCIPKDNKPRNQIKKLQTYFFT